MNKQINKYEHIQDCGSREKVPGERNVIVVFKRESSYHKGLVTQGGKTVDLG